MKEYPEKVDAASDAWMALSALALYNDWPSGSEMAKVARMANPKCAEDYGLSADFQRCLKELGLWDGMERRKEVFENLSKDLARAVRRYRDEIVLRVLQD